MMKPFPSISLAFLISISESPTWTPEAPASKAMSGRSLMISGTPYRPHRFFSSFASSRNSSSSALSSILPPPFLLAEQIQLIKKIPMEAPHPAPLGVHP